jgi:hypothetical protein
MQVARVEGIWDKSEELLGTYWELDVKKVRKHWEIFFFLNPIPQPPSKEKQPEPI